MTVILIVEKNGSIKETNVKNLQISELYKKAGFKSAEGFEQPIVSWPRPGIDPFTLDYQIQVYGKTKGRAGQENKYDFPPPIDTTLFFGSVILVAVRPGGVVVDLTTTSWEMVYEQLFGGFEDLVDSHGNPLDDSESEDEELEGVEYTKEGYVKDDFIVDDDEIEDEEYVEKKVFRKNMIDDSEEDSDFELPKTRKNKQLIKEKKEKKEKKSKKDKKAKQEEQESPDESQEETKQKNKKSKKEKKKEVVEIQESAMELPQQPSSNDLVIEDTEEEIIKPSKKQRAPRVPKAPKPAKEPKVKKVKEPKIPKEKAEPKKKSKRGGKKDTEDLDNSESVYVPIDTMELEEESYV